MYIETIDDIISKTLDKIFIKWIMGNQDDVLLNINELLKESNFIKYQKKINEMINLFFALISQEEILKIVVKNLNIILIDNLVKKFICYYFFILLGINYKTKYETFNNNLIEFSRSQVNFSIKVDNFFNSETNSILIKVILFINELYDLLNKINILDKKLKEKKSYVES